MARSMVFLLTMVLLAAVGILGLLALKESPPPAAIPYTVEVPRPSGGGGALEPSKLVQGAAKGWLELQRHEQALLEAVLRQIPSRVDISRWLDPSQAAKPRLSMPRPDRPPQPYPVLDLPDIGALTERAQADLVGLSAQSGLPLLVLSYVPSSGSARTLVAKGAGDTAHEAILAWLASGPAGDGPIHTIMDAKPTPLYVSAVPVSHSGGVLWVVGARPVDAKWLNIFQETAPLTANLVYEGKSILGFGPDLGPSVQESLLAISKQSLGKVLEVVVGATEKVTSAAISFPSMDAKNPAPLLTLVFSAPVVASSEAAPVAAPSGVPSGSDQSFATRITSSPLLQSPTDHLPALVILLVALLALPILGRLLLTLDLRAAYMSLIRRVNVDQPLNRIDLNPIERQILDTVISRHAPRLPAAPQPPPASATQEQRLRAENDQLRQELESIQSHSRQIEKQLEFARKKVNDSAEEARTTAAAAATATASLQGQIKDLQNQIKDLQSQPPPSAAAAPTRRPPPPASKPSSASRSSANRSVVPSSANNQKDFDTAEVSGDDISQLLGSTDPSSDALSSSFTELAQQLGSMSQSQVAKLPDAPALKSRNPGMDPSKITAMGLPRAELLPSFPTPHQPGPHKAEEDRSLTERIDRAAIALEPPAPARSALQTQPLSSGIFGIDDDIAITPPDSPPSARPRRPSLASAPQALSPAGLLEALKRRGQQEAAPPAAAASTNEPATRVTPMSITRELLDQSRPEAPPETLSHSGIFSRTGSKLDSEPANDSEYFKALYEDFLATKRSCGESTDNITMERFVNRLARNKQALVERYNCGTVRFQVYVKDGRAALKATPVK